MGKPAVAIEWTPGERREHEGLAGRRRTAQGLCVEELSVTRWMSGLGRALSSISRKKLQELERPMPREAFAITGSGGHVEGGEQRQGPIAEAAPLRLSRAHRQKRTGPLRDPSVGPGRQMTSSPGQTFLPDHYENCGHPA
jgi:hypothetical protein